MMTATAKPEMPRETSAMPNTSEPTSTPPAALARQADEQALRSIDHEINEWLFYYVQVFRDVDPVFGRMYDPMPPVQIREFVAAHYRELWTKVPDRLTRQRAEIQARLDGPTIEIRESAVLPPKEGKRRRGRPGGTDPREDKRIFDAWKSGAHKDYADLARNLRKSKRDIAKAIDRHRHRLARGAAKRRTNSPDR
jgi:hypothetical protein